jgi:hypothetical protein
LSIRKNERKGESDEPDAPLLREGENSAWEGDVVIGREQSDQANNTANDGLQQGFAIKPQPPPGRWSIQILKFSFHPKQRNPTPTSTSLVHAHYAAPWRLLRRLQSAHPTFSPCSPAAAASW